MHAGRKQQAGDSRPDHHHDGVRPRGIGRCRDINRPQQSGAPGMEAGSPRHEHEQEPATDGDHPGGALRDQSGVGCGSRQAIGHQATHGPGQDRSDGGQASCQDPAAKALEGGDVEPPRGESFH